MGTQKRGKQRTIKYKIFALFAYVVVKIVFKEMAGNFLLFHLVQILLPNEVIQLFISEHSINIRQASLPLERNALVQSTI